MNFTPFSCPECGGDVLLRSGTGRFREIRRGVPPLEIPSELEIPQCSQCGEIYVLAEQQAEVDAALRKPLREWQATHIEKLVAFIADRHDLTRRQVASICGVTPAYLSNVTSGRKLTSTAFPRLLEAFARCGEEVERHRRGLVFDMRCVPGCEWASAKTPKVRHSTVKPPVKPDFEAFTRKRPQTRKNEPKSGEYEMKLPSLPPPSRTNAS